MRNNYKYMKKWRVWDDDRTRKNIPRYNSDVNKMEQWGRNQKFRITLFFAVFIKRFGGG